MRTGMIAAALGLASLAAGAAAADDEAGAPLTPAEAAGSWTLETGGHGVCLIRLEAARTGAAYAARSEPACGRILGGEAVGWRPTRDGMRLIGADGAALLGFSRWSNSLFVSHRASGVDVQLRRGDRPVRPPA